MHRHSPFIVVIGLFVGAVFSAGAAAAVESDASGIQFFENKIRPVLAAKCYECHSADSSKVKGGLLLDTRYNLRKGGDSGPVIQLKDPEESLLIKAIKHDGISMPPKGKLAADVVDDFVHWIKLGAPDPREGAGTPAYQRLTLEEAGNFWSFQIPRKHPPPQVRNGDWPANDVDRFILAKLEANNLTPVGDADRATLIRRLSFDLIGLPPTPAEIDAFEHDRSPDAVEKAVDRLLASPRFGERWGRHWLDTARYAESNGNTANIIFPEAWRYRDYVIDSFNRDKPYDRFLFEQIAGDRLPFQTAAERDAHLIATGFLALASRPRSLRNPDYKFDLIADQIDVTTRAILGLTVQCARCHDHKFDPVSTEEYYALAGIFESSQMLFGVRPNNSGNNNVEPAAGLHQLSNGEAMGVREGEITNSRICIRGETINPGDEVERGFLSVVSGGKRPAINSDGSGRLELAEWLTRPENPLTARVMVNRVWLHLFGKALVPTVDNFGVLGLPPSHPELLDTLAVRFQEEGWSIKKLIRTLALSRSYRLASSHQADNFQVDPDNVLRWRMDRRRLEAEPIRDAILFVGGELDLSPPHKSLVVGAKLKKNTPKGENSNHRSVYLPMIRNGLLELLSIFDAADPSQIVGRRDATTVPTQALFLMNSPWVAEQARLLAQRVEAGAENDSARIDLAYRITLSRPATAGERERTLKYLAEAGTGGWTNFCQTLLASAEFRYLQ